MPRSVSKVTMDMGDTESMQVPKNIEIQDSENCYAKADAYQSQLGDDLFKKRKSSAILKTNNKGRMSMSFQSQRTTKQRTSSLDSESGNPHR